MEAYKTQTVPELTEKDAFQSKALQLAKPSAICTIFCIRHALSQMEEDLNKGIFAYLPASMNQLETCMKSLAYSTSKLTTEAKGK